MFCQNIQEPGNWRGPNVRRFKRKRCEDGLWQMQFRAGEAFEALCNCFSIQGTIPILRLCKNGQTGLESMRAEIRRDLSALVNITVNPRRARRLGGPPIGDMLYLDNCNKSITFMDS